LYREEFSTRSILLNFVRVTIVIQGYGLSTHALEGMNFIFSAYTIEIPAGCIELRRRTPVEMVAFLDDYIQVKVDLLNVSRPCALTEHHAMKTYWRSGCIASLIL
jgi:hypothetical protein